MRARVDPTLAGVLVAVVVFLGVVRLAPGGPVAARAVDDVGQLLAAALACAATARRAWHSRGRATWSWLLLALGTGSWTLGEAAWSYLELLAGRETPFPSVADAGFLLFPVFAVAGLLLWPSVSLVGGARWRSLLDGVLVACSLFVLTWVTALGSVVRGGGDTPFAYAVSLAYPVADLVLLTLTVVLVAHARSAPGSGLGLLAAGLASLALADSGFAYLGAVDRYATGSPVDAGWFGGFLLIAAAARSATEAGVRGPAAAAPQESSAGLESTAAALLPYVPAGLGLGVAVAGDLAGRDDPVALGAATVVLVALLARQLLAVLDNRRLVARLVEAEQELRHQAFHDPLTGLANRALFADRLRHGLDLHRRDLRPLGLLYCDLDGFKPVNDEHGHEAGDAVLRAVAERLRAVTRPGDTVARLGGDEFAVLLEDGGDALAVAVRLLSALDQPVQVGRTSLAVRASIGIADLSPLSEPTSAAALLQRADTAMYVAKRQGKGVVVPWTEALEERQPAVRPVPVP